MNTFISQVCDVLNNETVMCMYIKYLRSDGPAVKHEGSVIYKWDFTDAHVHQQ